MDTSEKLFEQAQKVMPGGVNSPVRAYRAVGMTPRFIQSAKGAYITDVDGVQYIDYVGSWGPMILGRRCRLNHGVLTADRIRSERQIKALLCLDDDVQIAECRLDHEDVRALLHIQLALQHGLAAVVRVHLIRLSVTERRCRACGIAERAVKCRGIFCGIRHNRDVDKAVVIENLANRSDTAVHHIGRRNHVRARLCVRQRNLCQTLQRLVVVHIVVAQNAAVAVRGVLTHAHVGNHIKIRILRLDGADCLLYNAVFRPCTGTDFVLVRRQAEQHDLFHARLDALLDGLTDAVGRPLELTRQRCNRVFDVLALNRKNRVNQAGRGHAGFAHHRAKGWAGAQSARTID